MSQPGGPKLGEPSDISSVLPIAPAATSVAAQLELYARDVQMLHGQRAAVSAELRKLEKKLVFAEHEHEQLAERLEREHQRLLQSRERVAEVKTVAQTARRGDGTMLAVGMVAGGFIVAAAAAVAILAASALGLLPGLTRSQPPAVMPLPQPTATTPVIVATTDRSPPSAAELTRLLGGLAAPAAVPAAAAPPLTVATPARCAIDLVVPPLAEGAAYVTKISQQREDQVTVLWPTAGGRIALAAAPAVLAGVPTPAIIPLAQVPPQFLQMAKAGTELTVKVPAGLTFAALINDSPQRLPQSRAIVFYAGDSACG